MKDAPLSTNERRFILQCLEHDHRVDGRRFFDFRDISISFGRNYGQVYVELGHTKVMVVVTSEAVVPRPERPTEGFFQFFTEFSPLASPEFEIGRPTESQVELGRVVERGLRESRAIDTEALCIAAGRLVWSVKCAIHVLDNDGNLADCASIATITALMHFRRPDVTVTGSKIILHTLEERPPVPLSIHHIPICVSFAFFGDDGSIVVVDPCLKEELAMQGRMTMALNSQQEICAVQKGGGIPVPVSAILQCSRIAASKVHEITALIKKALEEHNSARIKKPVPPASALSVQPVQNTIAFTATPVFVDTDSMEVSAAAAAAAAAATSINQHQHDTLPPPSPLAGPDSPSMDIIASETVHAAEEQALFQGAKSAWEDVEQPLAPATGGAAATTKAATKATKTTTKPSTASAASKKPVAKKKPSTGGGAVDLSVAIKPKAKKKP